MRPNQNAKKHELNKTKLKLREPAQSSLERLMLDFLDHLEIEKNRSLLTRKNYEMYLARFLYFVCERIGKPSADDISYDMVRQFRLWLHRMQTKSGESLSASTENYHLIALRSFLKYLAKRDIKTLAAEKVELGKMPERHVSFLEGAELQRLLRAPFAIKQNQLVAARDHAIMEMLFSTGLRVSELAALRRDAVETTKCEIGVLGKGRKRRVVFVSPQARDALKKYIEMRRDMSPALFVNHDRAHGAREKKKTSEHSVIEGLTPRSIQRMIEKYARAAGITKKVTPHVMRHSFATDLLHNGADIRSVQAMLGHSSITTTQVYTHVTDPQLKRIHEQFHSRD